MQREHLSRIRTSNKMLLLRKIRDMQPVSIPQLAKATGLQRSTVLRLINILKEQKLVKSLGLIGPEGGAGRPAMQWALNDEYAACLGLYLSPDAISGMALDINLNILTTCVLPIAREAGATGRAVRELLPQMMNILTDPRKIGSRPLVGIGVASKSLIEHETQSIHLQQEGKIEIGKVLAQWNCPILLENDANAVARGETLHGSIAGVRNAIVFYAREKMGVGLILNGELYYGADSVAGEVGFGGRDFIPNPLTDPDPYAIDRFIDGICLMINLLNPEAVVLTGDLYRLPTSTMKTLIEATEAWVSPAMRNVRVMTLPCDQMQMACHMATIVLNHEIFQQAGFGFKARPEPPIKKTE